MDIKKNLKRSCLTFGIGLFGHGFALMNILQNYDSVEIQPMGYGTGITSGRWFLTIIGDIGNKLWGGYNVPYFNNLIALFILTICSILILDLFDIRSFLFKVIWGSCFVSFPTVASTFIFSYTSVYYTLAIFLAILGVYFVYKTIR